MLQSMNDPWSLIYKYVEGMCVVILCNHINHHQIYAVALF